MSHEDIRNCPLVSGWPLACLLIPGAGDIPSYPDCVYFSRQLISQQEILLNSYWQPAN
jgi:hypothetical protein